jgi:hypothetical protein
LDGGFSTRISELLNSGSRNILIPNYGMLTGSNYRDNVVIDKPKVIVETLNTCDFSPSMFSNLGLVAMNSKSTPVESLVRAFFNKE